MARFKKSLTDQLNITEEALGLSLERFDTIFRYNGADPERDNSHISMKDALDVPNAAFLIPRVLTTFVQEGLEPMLIGTNLLQRLEYTPGMQTVFPAIDTLVAREVGDGMSLPIVNINVGGGTTNGVTVKRHGLQLKISQRFVEQSTYPWLQWWMKLAGQALARHKEEKIFQFITGLGTSIYDNSVTARTTSNPTQPVKGCTTGRNLKGQFNGSMTFDDIFDMYATILMQGFIPDTILMHPLNWVMWVKDPILREFAIQAGGGSFFANFTGNAHAQAFANQYNFGGLGTGHGQTGKFTNGSQGVTGTGSPQGLPQAGATSAPVLSSYLGVPFKILVSPFVRFVPQTRVTDIMMFDSRNLGALIVDEDAHVNSWNEPQFNIHNVGIEETYGFAILNEGQSIGTAKNIKIRPNEFVLPSRSVININESGSLFEELSSVTNFGTTPLDVNSR